MNIVVDASSFVSLFLPDEDSAAVSRYLDEADTVAAPELAVVETAAAFFRRARNGSLTMAHANAAAGIWMQTVNSGGVIFHADKDLVRQACEIAVELNHALQDCIYLELARMLKYALLTSDRVFARKATSIYPDVLTSDHQSCGA